MKALALIALSLALEAGFLLTLAVPAGEVAVARRSTGVGKAPVVLVGSPAAPAPRRS